ncbi:Skt5p [Saccharomyces eubayanus]|uniref:Skt5p n=1 Tax=Saccharomyces eubayanus TaxID=1080349 RepID=UPI0006C2E881|nr:SKT5-like protein [Saccharomyces eubayanus]KOH00785.1 SKT5-like protein [Saccharomyces eubayanus]
MATSSQMHPYKKHLMQSQHLNFDNMGTQFQSSMKEANSDLSGKKENSRYDHNQKLSSAALPKRTANQFIPNEHSRTSSAPLASSSNNNSHEGADLALAPPPHPRLHSSHSNSVTSLGSTPTNSSSLGALRQTSSNTSLTIEQKNKRTRSVDLSHMYLLNSSNDTQMTATNESVADLSHQMISRYLGGKSNTSLVPRLKTIEMYRQNVKKSKDPEVLFQYAQYMLQTALTIESSNALVSNTEEENVSQSAMKTQFLKEAQSYLKKLSIKGYSDAQYLLGDGYASGAFGKIENKEAFVLFQAAAKHGHIESAYRASHCLEEGLGTTRDSRKSINFLKFAASRNHPSAMYKLGLYSFYGRMGLPTDVTTKLNGVKWLSRASARANELTAAAPYELAKIYDEGFLDVVIPDEKYAMELYIQAASLGHIPSATLLAQIYETGNDTVGQDTSLSVHYYTQAALKGDPVAMLGLCAWYLLGAEPAFEKDENEAFQWALRAANAGLPKAQFTLGYFYEHGKGCECNLEYAWKWYEKAAEKNDKRAINKLGSREGGIAAASKKQHKKNKSVSTLNLFSTTDNGLGNEGSFAKPSSTVSSKSETFFTGNSKRDSEPQGLQINMNNNVKKGPSPIRTPQKGAGQSTEIKPNGQLLNMDNLGGAGRSPSGTNLEPRKSNNLLLKDKKDKQNKKKKKDCIIM